MKILIVSSRFPYPLEKGDKLRLYHQIEYLSKVHEIVLCSLTEEDINQNDLDAIAPFCSNIYVFKLSKFRLIIRLLRSIIKRLPFSIGYFYSVSIQRKINNVIKEELPDHIYCNLIRTSEYIKDVQIKKSIDYMDAFSSIMQKRYTVANIFMKGILKREYILLNNYEQKIFYSFDNHCIISEQDRNTIPFKNAQNIEVIPNGIDIDYFKPNDEIQKEFDLVFVGNLGYHPNVIAVKYFMGEILPSIILKYPNIKILIAGARPDNQILKMANQNITIEGWLSDIRMAYWRSKIMVAPIFQGAGQQNKILESMACGVPCITTNLVNNPYNAENNNAILLANNANEFAAQIERLIENKLLYNDLVQNSLQFSKKFSWEAFGDKLAKLLEKDNW